jgi:hypothetical protein
VTVGATETAVEVNALERGYHDQFVRIETVFQFQVTAYAGVLLLDRGKLPGQSERACQYDSDQNSVLRESSSHARYPQIVMATM